MAKRNDTESKLSKIYYDPASVGAYGGVARLLAEARKQHLNVKRQDVEQFLTDQHTYSLHKPVRKVFERNHTYVSGIDKQWQADLADMQGVSSENGGARFLLTCIDVFSKYAWVVPVKDKGATTMTKAFEILLASSAPRKPVRLQTDKGNEFLCKSVQTLLKSQNIQHFTTDSDKKAAVVERFNRTIKSRIWKYFTAKRTRRYVDVLQDFVRAYNSSKHRSINMKPEDVRPKHQTEIWRRLYGDGSLVAKKSDSITRGQMVRINRWKGDFEKGYMPNWSAEDFHVENVIKHPHTMYELRDNEDQTVRGAFYRKEVQPIRTNKMFVDKVLRRRTAHGVREVFVKWKGWPARFNSWINQNELSAYQ